MIIQMMRDPFGERRGAFCYGAILSRLQEIGASIPAEEGASGDDDSDGDGDGDMDRIDDINGSLKSAGAGSAGSAGAV